MSPVWGKMPGGCVPRKGLFAARRAG